MLNQLIVSIVTSLLLMSCAHIRGDVRPKANFSKFGEPNTALENKVINDYEERKINKENVKVLIDLIPEGIKFEDGNISYPFHSPA